MRILQYIKGSRIGGAETYLLRLIEHLRDRGHRVVVASRAGTPIFDAVKGRGFDIHSCHYGGRDPRSLWAVARLAKRENVELIHTHLPSTHRVGALAGKLLRKPVVGHVHAAGENTSYLRDTPHVIACANGVRDDLTSRGLPSEKIKVLYYGINLDDYSQPLPTETARGQFDVPIGAHVVCVVASLTERKGHRFLLRAMKQIEPTTGPIYALFAGEGGEKANLQNLARELGIEERVRFTGFSDARHILSASDVFVLPSRLEGLSIAATEAMAMRCPVLATDVAGMPELVQHDHTGLLVPPFEEEPLAAALQKLLLDGALRQRLAKAGRQLVEERFDDRRTLEQAEQYLVELAARGRS